MSYQEGSTGNEQFADTVAAPDSQLTTATTSGTLAAYEVGASSELRLALVVTAISGASAQIVVQAQTSFDNGATDAYRNIGSPVTATAVGTTHFDVSGLDRWVQYVYTITGTTPSVTFQVTGEVAA